ncbi:hypothetical protein HA402_014145 [Bradysia odoriphaga]|nr:hypothetical protein HA402_014145 [Bradysia odoriphaga]
MQASRAIIRSLAPRSASFLSRSAAYHDGHHKITTMDDLPVPEGDWRERYQQTQSKNNAILAASFLFFVGVVGYIKQSGVINFNYSPPTTYE